MNVLDDWTQAVIRELRLDPIDRDLILDLTRDVARGVARPAAPLTAFLVGLAAGRAGGAQADVQTATDRVLALLADYAPPSGDAE